MSIAVATTRTPREPDGSSAILAWIVLAWIALSLILGGCEHPDKPGGLGSRCPCDDPYFCGPSNACTKMCLNGPDCGGDPGSICLEGMCAIVCNPDHPTRGDCNAIVPASECLDVQGYHVCGYGSGGAE